MDLVSAMAGSAVFAALGVAMARGRGRGGLPWGLIGALFPFVRLLLLIVPKLDSPRASRGGARRAALAAAAAEPCADSIQHVWG